MSMIEHLQRLFVYDDWANHEVLAALESATTLPPRSLKYLAHIAAAERLWLERLRLEKQTYPVWPDFTLEHCKLEITGLRDQWKSYLASLKEDGLSRELTYRNSKGESFTNAKQDILTHVIMHSAYHRGQIATDMRAAGLTPAYTDFIHGVRQGLVE
jgi:uncharacterized damage-inducible protein DinB